MKREWRVIAILFFLVSALGLGNLVQGAEVKPIELKIMHFAAPNHVVHKDVFIPWCKMLEERTGGRVKGTIYPGELLGKVKDTYDLIVAGTADIGWAYGVATPGRFPLSSVFELPLLFPNSKVGSRVVWEMFEKEPSLKAEYREVKVLWLHTVTPMQLHTIKKPIRSLEDLKGMKIRSVGGVAPSVLKALGAVPVVMPTPDVYVALERGTVDGTIGAWEQLGPFKFYEVTKYHTVANLWVGQFYVVMNSKRWESFPPDIQKVVDGISGTWGADLAGMAWDKEDLRGIEMVKGLKDHEVISLAPDEFAKWRKAIRPIWDEWVEEKEAKGLPGRKILDELIRLIEKHTK